MGTITLTIFHRVLTASSSRTVLGESMSMRVLHGDQRMYIANNLNHTWYPLGNDYRLAINAFLEAHGICPVTPMRHLSFSNYIFAAFISHPYFVDLPSWNIYSRSDAKRLLGWVLILRIHDGKRSSTDEMSCHTIVGMWRVIRFSDPTCQILLFRYTAVPFTARLTLHQST
jgi:hypothetical protein